MTDMKKSISNSAVKTAVALMQTPEEILHMSLELVSTLEVLNIFSIKRIESYQIDVRGKLPSLEAQAAAIAEGRATIRNF